MLTQVGSKTARMVPARCIKSSLEREWDRRVLLLSTSPMPKLSNSSQSQILQPKSTRTLPSMKFFTTEKLSRLYTWNTKPPGRSPIEILWWSASAKKKDLSTTSLLVPAAIPLPKRMELSELNSLLGATFSSKSMQTAPELLTFLTVTPKEISQLW